MAAGFKQGAYAAKRQLARQVRRAQIHDHVVHPIDTPQLVRDPLVHPKSPIDATISTMKFVLTAAAIHALIISLFAVVSDLVGEETSVRKADRVDIEVIDVKPKPPEPPPIQQLPTAVQPVPVVDDFVPKEPEPKPEPKAKEEPPPKPKKPPPKAKEEPPEVPEAEPAPAEPPRRVIGVSYESTTTGGKGPSLAVGTSRMGETASRAEDVRTATQRNVGGTQQGTGNGGGAVGEGQRAASFIPQADKVLVKPKRLQPSKPAFPSVLKAQGIEGDVKVRVTINAQGKVVDVKIAQSSGHQAFDDAAKAAAFAEEFSAATENGKAISYTLSYSYRFRIEDT